MNEKLKDHFTIFHNSYCSLTKESDCIMRLSNWCLLFILSLMVCNCTASKRSSKAQIDKNIFRRMPDVSSGNKGIVENERYHSAYHTENAYYDGRNRILDCDFQGAIDILTADISALDYPDRAALWVFLCKCRIGDREGAVEYINKYMEKREHNPEDQSAIPNMLLFYQGKINEEKIQKLMISWDELDNCAAYYYYGAYKKYFDQDYVLGNEYIVRALRTKIVGYSEYKFAENDIKGFTYRDPGQYKDFPVSRFGGSEPGFLEPLPSDSTITSEFGEAVDTSDYILGERNAIEDESIDTFSDISSMKSETAYTAVPESLGEDQFVVPSDDNKGWEVIDRNGFLKIIRKEAVTILNNLMAGSDTFMLMQNDGIRYSPITDNFQTYAVSFEDYLKNYRVFEEDYGADYSSITLHLKNGDYLSGVRVPCQSWSVLSRVFEGQVMVSFNLLFSVRDDRATELTHVFTRVF